MTFEDVAIFFFREEWRLLDEAQRQLYLGVMLESFALVTSLDYWLGMENGKLPFDQISAEGLSLVRIPKASSANQESNPCDVYVPVLKGILHLVDQLRQKSCLIHMCSHLPQDGNYPSSENASKTDSYMTSQAKDCSIGVPQKPSAEVGKNLPAALDLLPPQTTSICEQPNLITACGEGFQTKVRCSKQGVCREALSCKHTRDHHPKSQCWTKTFRICQM
ncbi:zinc finger protein 416-like [Acomys russatus]|uniref:zinc finger protein 416-like n=1 Tax=Acomys russatus TaxID=60746 RepID=UPI0021E26D63|nr:zinc finger protein 416-like [Acomys russatus]